MTTPPLPIISASVSEKIGPRRCRRNCRSSQSSTAAPTTSCGPPSASHCPLSDPGVLNDLKKVLAGKKLSPVLVAEGDIADGYHRVSLAYALDPYTDVPLKLG